MRQRGKLYNGDGEMIAEGFCELGEEGSQVTMWPALEKGLFERERGVLILELEGSAAPLRISERRLQLESTRLTAPAPSSTACALSNRLPRTQRRRPEERPRPCLSTSSAPARLPASRTRAPDRQLRREAFDSPLVRGKRWDTACRPAGGVPSS